jgi:hypothetical protein
VADLFGDTDTRASAAASLVVEGDFDEGFDAAALLAAAERLAPAASPPRFGLVYGSGLESHTHLLAQLADGRRLFGSAPATVARTKNPQEFFALLDRLGLPYPTIAYSPPADPAGWLTKQVSGSETAMSRRRALARRLTATAISAADGRPAGGRVVPCERPQRGVARLR